MGEQQAHDWYDWATLAAQLLVGPLIALAAAWIGVREGGKQARQSTITAMQEEARQARLEKRDQLIQRLRYVLPRIAGISDSMSRRDKEHPIPKGVLQEIVLLWQSYDRLSDYGIYLAPEFDARVRTYIMEAGTVAAIGIEDEERDLSMKLAGHPAFTGQPQANRGTVMRRGQTMARLMDCASQGKQLIQELEQIATRASADK